MQLLWSSKICSRLSTLDSSAAAAAAEDNAEPMLLPNPDLRRNAAARARRTCARSVSSSFGVSRSVWPGDCTRYFKGVPMAGILWCTPRPVSKSMRSSYSAIAKGVCENSCWCGRSSSSGLRAAMAGSEFWISETTVRRGHFCPSWHWVIWRGEWHRGWEPVSIHTMGNTLEGRAYNQVVKPITKF